MKFTEVCTHDRENYQNTKMNHIEFDLLLMAVSGFLLWRNLKKSPEASKNQTQLFSNNHWLKIIRLIGAVVGCAYLKISFTSQNITLTRWLIGQFRMLTENFIIFLTLYYVFATIFTFTKKPSCFGQRFWNTWYSANLIGATFVSVGFWVFIAFIGALKGLYTFNKYDLLGHCCNLLWIIAEYRLIPKVVIQNTSLYFVLLMVSCYTTTMYILQQIGIVCWIPYAPYSTNMHYKAFFVAFVVAIFYCLKKCINKK